MKLTISDNSIQVANNFEKQIREQPLIVKTALGRTAEFLIGLIKQRTQRDASLRATEIVASITVGSGVLKDTYGVTVKVDTAL